MTKLSLSLSACLVLLSTQAFSADSIEDALKNGKVSGAVQAYNFSRNVDGGNDYQITTLNLDLSYETARINGFGAKATFQVATSPGANQTAKDARSGDMYGSGSQLSEMYLSYAAGNTTVQAGRMYFWSPLLGGSGSRPTKEAFQGVSIVNTDLDDTTVTLAYMNRMQSRTDGNGNIGEFTKTFTGWDGSVLEDGAYTVALTNKSVKNLTLTAAYLDAIDAYKTAYLEGAYKFSTWGLSSQYFYSKQEADEATNLMGVQATTSVGSIDLLAAYVTVDDADGVIPGAGNGADLAYTWSEIFADQYRADQDSFKLQAVYKINKDANIGMSYVNEDDKANNKKYGYTALKGSYNITKAFNIWAAYEMGSQDAKNDGARIKLNYTF